MLTIHATRLVLRVDRFLYLELRGVFYVFHTKQLVIQNN